MIDLTFYLKLKAIDFDSIYTSDTEPKQSLWI